MNPDLAALDLRGLRAFVAVAEHGSVSTAATALGWSHPTVDHHLRGLERLISAPLLERSPRGTQPTELGELLLPRIRQVLALAQETVSAAHEWVRHRRQRVRIGAYPTAGTVLIPPLLERFAGSDIDLAVTLDETGALVEQLDGGMLDLAVIFTAGPDDDTLPRTRERFLLNSEPMRLLVPHTHPVHEATALRACADDRWAFGAGDRDPVDASVLRRCHDEGFEPVIGMRSDDYPATIDMIAAGLFVAVVPESVAQRADAGRDGRVRAVPIAGAPLRRDTVLAVERADAVVNEVAAALREIAAA
ncbi:LysR family transcriptional regulator [Gulosibacter macacae]|uniref:LysR family transcriptional regulator n=1 Tax=Gulosibacter macacae TaxID=2488791 RepID=A0A3P3VTT1_9MICO|nr:LysR family transcriptional regulator [Gulosibacter macacae]RRJ85854.1 LysR family transcriptional regulator [Gulosibacter macacae]